MTRNRAAKHYDGFSRLLHWSMAALVIWQLGGMLAKEIIGKTPLIASWSGTHGSVGLIILILALVRLLWRVSGRAVRPAYRADWLGRSARFGHMLFYAALIIIPSLAVLRVIGSGKGATFFGVELLAATGQKIPALMAPANAAHGLLGWILLALIIGHVAISFFHQLVLKDGTIIKMLSAPQQ